MKALIKLSALALGILVTTTSMAQTAEVAVESNAALAEAKLPEIAKSKEVTLAIRNSCEKPLNIFAGSKKEVFSGRCQPVGGLSNNKLYLMEGDVVCIMSAPKVISACSIIKSGVSRVEINPSGNGFTKQ